MAHLNLDLDVLRTLVTGLELGSFAKAADRLGRSTSAISSQMKKLESQIGKPVLRKSGRGVVLTATGEVVFAYARRLLELNDEALLAARDSELEGEIRLGVLEDFGEAVLTNVLGRFAHINPKLRLQAGVARNAELLRQVECGQLDLALAWVGDALAVRARPVARLPLCWIGREDSTFGRKTREPIPLAMLDAPCPLRTLATTALDKAGLPWRIAFTSPSLAGVWAAVGAGLGISVRTRAGLPGRLRVLEGLPKLPSIDLALYLAGSSPGPAVERLAHLLEESLLAAPHIPPQ
jgi:DNA-binding transcriptional LysR family regulator